MLQRKLGPTVKYMFTLNLVSAKFMVDVPWAGWFRRTFIRGHDSTPPDYRLRPAAQLLGAVREREARVGRERERT